ncbi:hypothetical protein ACWKWN_20680, partial [Microbacterium trichothecenolyticum]
KHGSLLPIAADARVALTELAIELVGCEGGREYSERIARAKAEWDAAVDAAYEPSGLALPGQPEIIAAVQSTSAPEASSLPAPPRAAWSAQQRARRTLCRCPAPRQGRS